MKKTYPADIKKKYRINMRQMAKWLDISVDCLYMRNYRKTPMKKIEIEFLENKIKKLK